MNYLYFVTGKAFDRPMNEYYFSDKQRTRKDIEGKMATRLHCQTVVCEKIVEMQIDIKSETEI